jgi:hypothetical protein
MVVVAVVLLLSWVSPIVFFVVVFSFSRFGIARRFRERFRSRSSVVPRHIPSGVSPTRYLVVFVCGLAFPVSQVLSSCSRGVISGNYGRTLCLYTATAWVDRASFPSVMVGCVAHQHGCCSVFDTAELRVYELWFSYTDIVFSVSDNI